MSGVRDLRREHFSDLPEPSKKQEPVKHDILGDQYMDSLEAYIEQLAIHVRRIQDEELSVTNQFSLALSSLQTKSHEKRRMREEVARDVYQKKISKVREKRKHYREMMYDALAERKKLIDSMQIQKDEDDILRRKLAKLSALSAAETLREQRTTTAKDVFAFFAILFQIGLIIMFGVGFDFSANAQTYNGVAAGTAAEAQPVAPFYQFFGDILMMGVVGFGFLMSFLRKYSYSAIGFTLLTVALTFQWALCVLNFYKQSYDARADDVSFSNVILTQVDLVVAMYGVITVLISFGAVLGVVSAMQLLFVGMFEIVFYGANLYAMRAIGLYDAAPWQVGFGFGGDSTTVHVFGAVFGLCLAAPIGWRVRKAKGREDLADSYQSDMFAMIGTVFLWVLWPSLNAALVPASVQHRVIVNSVMALCSSVVFAFLGSRVFRGGKFDMADIQSATLAGGVAMGNGAAVVVGPGSALIIGAVAAIVSTIGSAYLSPLLNKLGAVDTRGVLNMHALPGFIGALSSAVAIAIAFNDDDQSVFGQDLVELFPAGQSTAGFQIVGLVVTVAIAGSSGILVGLLLMLCTTRNMQMFDDSVHWRVPGDFEVSPEESK